MHRMLVTTLRNFNYLKPAYMKISLICRGFLRIIFGLSWSVLESVSAFDPLVRHVTYGYCYCAHCYWRCAKAFNVLKGICDENSVRFPDGALTATPLLAQSASTLWRCIVLSGPRSTTGRKKDHSKWKRWSHGVYFITSNRFFLRCFTT